MIRKEQKQEYQHQLQRSSIGKRVRTTTTANPNPSTTTTIQSIVASSTTTSIRSANLNIPSPPPSSSSSSSSSSSTSGTKSTFERSSIIPKRAVKPSKSNASEQFAASSTDKFSRMGSGSMGFINTTTTTSSPIDATSTANGHNADDYDDRVNTADQRNDYADDECDDCEHDSNKNNEMQHGDCNDHGNDNDVDDCVWRVPTTSTTEEWNNRHDTIGQRCQRYCRHVIAGRATDADIETTKQCILVVIMLVGVLLLVIGHDNITDHYHEIKTHNEQVLDTLVVEASADKYSAVYQAFHDAVNGGSDSSSGSEVENFGDRSDNSSTTSASVTRVIEIRNKTYETFHELFVPISSGFCSYVRGAVQTVVNDNNNNYTTNATGNIHDDVHFIFDITIDCSKLFQFSPVSGTGNWMYLYYTMRLVALAQRHTSILFTCTDYSFSKDLPKDLALPWLTGWFPYVNITSWKEDYDEKYEDVPSLDLACDDNFQDLVPMIPIVQQDLRRLAIGLIGPSPGHPSEVYAREHLSDNDSMNSYDATGSIYSVPVDYKNPLLSNSNNVIGSTAKSLASNSLASITETSTNTTTTTITSGIAGIGKDEVDIYGNGLASRSSIATSTSTTTTSNIAMVSPAIELDDVVIHFPCADVFDSASSANNKLASLEEAYGFYKYSFLTQFISPEAKSIGILTQSYDDNRKEVSDAEHGPPSIDEQSAIIADPTINATTTASLLVDGVLPSVSDRCYKIISGLIRHIKKEFSTYSIHNTTTTFDNSTNVTTTTSSPPTKRPLPRITVHDSSHDTATVAIARMVMANQTIAAASSFSILAGMATFGTAYIPTNDKLRWLGQSRYDNASAKFRHYNNRKWNKRTKQQRYGDKIDDASSSSGTEGYYNATDDWGTIEFVDGTINNTFTNIDDIVRIWVETPDGEERILEWFRNDTYQLDMDDSNKTK